MRVTSTVGHAVAGTRILRAADDAQRVHGVWHVWGPPSRQRSDEPAPGRGPDFLVAREAQHPCWIRIRVDELASFRSGPATGTNYHGGLLLLPEWRAVRPRLLACPWS